MGKVSAGATMSIDGFIAGPHDTGFDMLFRWYGAGEVEVPMPDSTAGVPPPRVAAASAELMQREQAGWGALVVGRHLYDLVGGWGGRHPLGVTTVVLTHRPPDNRPQVADPALPPMQLEGPTLVVEGEGVTHLRYRVVR